MAEGGFRYGRCDVVLPGLTVGSDLRGGTAEEASETEGLAFGTDGLFSDLHAPHEGREGEMKDRSQRSVQGYRVAEEAAPGSLANHAEQADDLRPGMVAAE